MEGSLTFKPEVPVSRGTEKRLETAEAATEHTVHIPETILETAGKFHPGLASWEEQCGRCR
jgi:hypothetical protein